MGTRIEKESITKLNDDTVEIVENRITENVITERLSIEDIRNRIFNLQQQSINLSNQRDKKIDDYNSEIQLIADKISYLQGLITEAKSLGVRENVE